MPLKLLTEVTSEVKAVLRNGNESPSIYIKSNSKDNNSPYYGDVKEEYRCYQVISPYLSVPKAKTRKIYELGDVLITQNVGMENLSKLYMLGETNIVISTLNLLYTDIFSMWGNTIKEMNERLLSRNSRLETLKTLNYILRLIEKDGSSSKIIINSVEYPPIQDLIIKIQNKLQKENAEHIMVLSHGDEHFGNIFKTFNGYKIIDPRASGFYYPSQTINTTIGSTIIFMENGCVAEVAEEKNILRISLKLSEKLDLIIKEFSSIYKASLHFTGLSNIMPELLYVNLVRSYFGLVNSKNIAKVKRDKYTILALAYLLFEHFNLIKHSYGNITT